MKKLLYPLAALAAVAMLGAATSSCSKVDCDKYCNKMTDCFAEITSPAGKTPSEQQRKLLKGLAKTFKATCKADCKKKKGRGRDASKINKCLGKSGCEAFAKCMRPLIKKARKK